MSAKLPCAFCKQTEAGAVHAPAAVATIYMSAAMTAQGFMPQRYAQPSPAIKSR